MISSAVYFLLTLVLFSMFSCFVGNRSAVLTLLTLAISGGLFTINFGFELRSCVSPNFKAYLTGHFYTDCVLFPLMVGCFLAVLPKLIVLRRKTVEGFPQTK